MTPAGRTALPRDEERTTSPVIAFVVAVSRMRTSASSAVAAATTRLSPSAETCAAARVMGRPRGIDFDDRSRRERRRDDAAPARKRGGEDDALDDDPSVGRRDDERRRSGRNRDRAAASGPGATTAVGEDLAGGHARDADVPVGIEGGGKLAILVGQDRERRAARHRVDPLDGDPRAAR